MTENDEEKIIVLALKLISGETIFCETEIDPEYLEHLVNFYIYNPAILMTDRFYDSETDDIREINSLKPWFSNSINTEDDRNKIKTNNVLACRWATLSEIESYYDYIQYMEDAIEEMKEIEDSTDFQEEVKNEKERLH